MEPETALRRVLDYGLQFAPILGEVLGVAADDGSIVLEPYVDLPGRGVGGTSSVLLQIARVIAQHPFDHVSSASHGLHEVVVPHVSVIPRDEIALKIILNLVSASGERTDLHFKQCDIVVHLSLDLHLAVLPLVDPYTEDGAGSRGDDHHVIEHNR